MSDGAGPIGGHPPPLAILAGGLNTRMRSLRETVYKGFLPIEEASLVARHLLRATLFGVRDVVVITDEDDALVHRALADPPGGLDGRPGRPTVRHEVCPGSLEVKLARAAELHGRPSRLLAVLGDTVAGVDLAALADAVDGRSTDAAMAVAPLRLPYGQVTLDPTGARITCFDEKPLLETVVYTGYLCLGRRPLAGLATTDLARILADLADTGRLASIMSTTEMWALDTPADLARLVTAADRPDDERNGTQG
jgi:NDP-sugar pyrophosphorylase family protein